MVGDEPKPISPPAPRDTDALQQTVNRLYKKYEALTSAERHEKMIEEIGETWSFPTSTEKRYFGVFEGSRSTLLPQAEVNKITPACLDQFVLGP